MSSFADVRHHPAIDDRERLLLRLRDAGEGDGDLRRAEAEGRLPTLAVELALGGTRQHTLTHVASEAGVNRDLLRELMRASGRPQPQPRERVFTDEDIELARLIGRFIEAGLPRKDLSEVARVLGQGMSQAADAVRRLVAEALLKPGDSEYTLALRYADAAEELTPLMASVLQYQLRAHLRDGIGGELLTEAERETGRLAGTREVAVAFADLVDYTRIGEQIPAEDLGGIAWRLGELAGKSARRPVQLVKMIGDAAMFVSPDAPRLVASVIDLVESVDAEGPKFPAVRVGVAYGPATMRNGDWFGAPVNVASRVTDLAKPGRILATEAVEERTRRWKWSRKRRRGLKGVDGRVRLFALDRD